MTEYTLGINCSHDGSIALFKDNVLLGTATKERFTRTKKHTNGNYKPLVDSLLSRFNITDVDYIAYNDNYLEDNDAYSLKQYCNIYSNKPNCSYVNTYIKNDNQYAINHHLGHCSYAFFTSNFSKSVCISLDGSPNEYAYMCTGNSNKIEKVDYTHTSASLLYDWFTYYILGNPLYKAGSVMGLSAYGNILNQNYKDFDGIEFDKYFKSLTGINPKLQKEEKNSITQQDTDVARTLQYVFEKLIIEYLNNIPDEIVIENDYNLCLSGGTFLNCNLNTKIKSQTKFKNVHIAPACSDDGLSVGYGLYLIHHILNKPRYQYSPKELMYSGASYEFNGGDDLDIVYIAEQIAQGKVIGLFQGNSEFGPRALGNRSILADPRKGNMKKYINSEVKRREWFRPFGATVLSEYSDKWFNNKEPSPYMLYTYDVLQDTVPAITHVDNTCRIQTLDRDTNELFYDIIREFYKLTGVPMVLNTSMNGPNEPIVETPDQALQIKNIDIFIIEKRMIHV